MKKCCSISKVEDEGGAVLRSSGSKCEDRRWREFLDLAAAKIEDGRKVYDFRHRKIVESTPIYDLRSRISKNLYLFNQRVSSPNIKQIIHLLFSAPKNGSKIGRNLKRRGLLLRIWRNIFDEEAAFYDLRSKKNEETLYLRFSEPNTVEPLPLIFDFRARSL